MLWFAVTLLAIDAHAKPIRLRSQTIHPPEKAAALAALRSSAAPAGNKTPPNSQTSHSGLFLIQFSGPIQPEWERDLAAVNIRLLQYIPEDTFLARGEHVQFELLYQQPYIQWLGDFRPEHKLEPKLLKHLSPPGPQAKPADEEIQIALLLEPHSNHAEITRARGLFRNLRQESQLRSGLVMRGKLNSARLQELASSPAVLWIEPARDMKMFDEISSKIVAGDGGANRLYTQSLGYDGTGVTVAVADSGLNNGDPDTMHPDLAGRTPAVFWYGNLTDGSDEHSHGTHVAGIVAGNGATGEMDENGALFGLGVAPGASIVGQRIFDGVGNYEAPPSYERLTRDAQRAGAIIGSNSWGDDTQGRYDLSAMEFDQLVRDADALTLGDQQYILEFSAGNAGPGAQTIGSPAVAKNVIATGAAENDRVDFLIYSDGLDAIADFSSRGPCEDGRIKPDIVAPGTWIASLQSQSATDQYAWGPISPNYQYQGGTSQAGPHASGAAAVFVQYYRATHTNATPSPALVKAALIDFAVDMFDDYGTAPVPNNDEGWGRIDLTALIGSTRSHVMLDQSVLLGTGQHYETRILVDSPDEEVKITLAYTDVPAFPGAIPALVNDLDLEVLAPDDHLYLGNQLRNGQSLPDPAAADNRNNVEGVRFLAPIPGEYLVRVKARNIAKDARIDTPALDQDFALVISASLAPPGKGIVTMNRRAYRAPDNIQLKLVDYHLAGQNTASILVRSTTEPAGENITLRASSATGSFTGAVATATGPALADGKLQVAHRDAIQAVYQDAAPPGTRLFEARADLVPPNISNVIITNRFGRPEVRWKTDEPATTIIRYGPDPSLAYSLTNSTLTDSNSVPLTNLQPGTTNYLLLVCTDEAGNAATNSNNGALFVFIAPRAPAILVVDAFFNDFLYDPPPPISGYTSVLDQLGLAYDLWDVATESATIAAADLKPYRVVIWRLPEASFTQPTLSPSDRTALATYLDGGGALFIASMEATSRLRDSGAAAFVHDVLHIENFTEDVTASGILGVDADPIGDGLSMLADYTMYMDFDLSDTLIPTADAVGFLESDGGGYVGVRYPNAGADSPSRVVYLSFPFDALDPADRALLLRRILVFLTPGLNGEGAVAFDRGAYTIPSQLTAEVADSDLEGLAQLKVHVSSTTQTNGISLMLSATPRPGVFRGSITLVKTNSGPGAAELLVRHGDTVWADYFDASINTTVRAQAIVKTNPPDLSFVAADPGYVDSLISWQSSEPADSTVQFGESPLLGRSATVNDFLYSHDVTISQLVPDRKYYYRVLSKDRAGNLAIDDNSGKMYTFRTLKPLAPPWSDDMEHGQNGWSLYTVEDSESGWELGVPEPLFASANSPTHCWGTNLRFEFRSQTESYLISPAILLTGGNKATLRFAHEYDFLPVSDFDILNGGEVLLIPNDALQPITLATYTDDLAAWHTVEFDLSPYVGQIVYLAFHYVLFSMDAWPREGWMIDDVSITMQNVAAGTVLVTNNLWQASAFISGPVSGTYKGRSAQITNAPAGSYMAEYPDVPYYQSPAAQTKTLAPGGTISFEGNYTFPDTNGNGISDLWELRMFGSVSTKRTNLTDTDGDGMSDHAEFLAGTDPNSPPRAFRLSAQRQPAAGAGPLTNLSLSFSTVVPQSYRLLSSSNLLSWVPASSWLEATGSQISLNLPANTAVAATHLRVQAGLTNSPPGLHPKLALNAEVTGSNVKLQWSAATGRAYRVLQSTNTITWTPLTAWFQATGTNSTQNVPFGPAGPNFFRVEVEP